MGQVVVPGEFLRPHGDLTWVDLHGETYSAALWQSNGGASRSHPSRALPFLCEIIPSTEQGGFLSVEITGIFALHAGLENEPAGTIGASLQWIDKTGRMLHGMSLVCGKHYGDASDGLAIDRINGDGSSVTTLGFAERDGQKVRVDRLRIELPQASNPAKIMLRDLGTSASFGLLSVALVGEVKAECPFRGHGRRVGLDELGSILRLRDRGRFDIALRQLDEGIRSTDDLDDARGSALTFLAVVSAALLEIGHSQKLHAFQLQAARRLDQLATLEEIADYASDCVHQLTEEVIPESRNPNDILIDRAIQVLERHYSADVTDTAIADRLGVSTSHFRHLFKQRTGQPFHKFLISMRLEQARLAILQTDRSIHEIAMEVGFQSPAHFSRAFTQRFGTPPSALRHPKTVNS